MAHTKEGSKSPLKKTFKTFKDLFAKGEKECAQKKILISSLSPFHHISCLALSSFVYVLESQVLLKCIAKFHKLSSVPTVLKWCNTATLEAEIAKILSSIASNIVGKTRWARPFGVDKWSLIYLFLARLRYLHMRAGHKHERFLTLTALQIDKLSPRPAGTT